MKRRAVSHLPPPFIAPVPPGPGSFVRNMLGWSQLEKTNRSGLVVPECLERGECIFFPCCSGRLGKERIVPHSVVSFLHGQGTAIGPHTGARCWPMLIRMWSAIAPLMKPWY